MALKYEYLELLKEVRISSKEVILAHEVILQQKKMKKDSDDENIIDLLNLAIINFYMKDIREFEHYLTVLIEIINKGN